MSELELTRDLLMDAGGWKEMKAAREMHRNGLVREASYENGVLAGVVVTGGKPKKVRMKIISRRVWTRENGLEDDGYWDNQASG